MDIAMHQAAASVRERQPGNRDRVIFFLVVPVGFAFLFSLVGIRLIAGMAYLDGLLYMVCHMLISWWSMSLGTWTSKRLLRPWRPAPLLLCAGGFLLALAPSSWLFMQLAGIYSELYPVFAANRVQPPPDSSLLEGVMRWARYSAPALILFAATVQVYRRAAGVSWLGYPAGPAAVPAGNRGEACPSGSSRPGVALAGRLPGSRLDPAAEVIAAKAEQHYICLYTTAGRDLVRYRFRDLSGLYADCDGVQVHRSWWVSLAHVSAVRRAGRSIELVLDNGLMIPVSLMHKNAALAALRERHPSVPVEGTA